MLKYAYFVSTFLILTACHQSKESVQESESWGAPEMVEELPEGDFTEEEWEEMMMEEENPYVRGIYNSSRTLQTDIVHTRLEVSFDWEHARLNGKEILTAKQHFYTSDSLILDAKGMDILSVEMNSKKLNYTILGSHSLT